MSGIAKMLEPLICKRFMEDERYRNGHIHVVAAAPHTKIMGVHTGEMKAVAHDVAKGDWRTMLATLKGEMQAHGREGLFHEERIVWGLILDYAKCHLNERIAEIWDFVHAIDNWAICDTFCCNSKWVKKCDQDEVWQFIASLMCRKEEFLRRTGLVLAMSHFLTESTLPRTLETISSLTLCENEPYYVRMAVAWLLATSLAKNPTFTRTFVSKSTLPRDIITLYIRKSRESFRTRQTPPL